MLIDYITYMHIHKMYKSQLQRLQLSRFCPVPRRTILKSAKVPKPEAETVPGAKAPGRAKAKATPKASRKRKARRTEEPEVEVPSSNGKRPKVKKQKDN